MTRGVRSIANFHISRTSLRTANHPLAILPSLTYTAPPNRLSLCEAILWRVPAAGSSNLVQPTSLSACVPFAAATTLISTGACALENS